MPLRCLGLGDFGLGDFGLDVGGEFGGRVDHVLLVGGCPDVFGAIASSVAAASLAGAALPRLRSTRARRLAALDCGRPRPVGATGTLLAGLDDGDALVAHAGDDHGDVARALVDAGRTATGTGAETLERRALVGEAGDDVELVGVLAVVVDGVGDGAGEHLADVTGDVAVGELQDLVGRHDVEATDQVEHHTGLRGRRTHVAGGGLRAGAFAGDERLLVELGTGHQRRPFVLRS